MANATLTPIEDARKIELQNFIENFHDIMDNNEIRYTDLLAMKVALERAIECERTQLYMLNYKG